MSLDAAQRSRLQCAKLSALVRDRVGSEVSATDVGPFAAAFLGGSAWVLAGPGPGALAGALLWATRNDVGSLEVFVDDGAEEMARWASYFALAGSDVVVRAVQGSSSVEVDAAPLPTLLPGPDDIGDLTEVLDRAGVDVVVEHGIARGEILGLEVARLVRWPGEVGGDDQLHLEAGVGRFDRDAVAAAHPDESPEDALDRTVTAVRLHRFPGAPVHPVQLLARERWLRTTILEDPSLVGAAQLRPVDMTTQADGLKDRHPAAALGLDHHGRSVVVVCSAGVDLAVVPLAADTVALHDPAARLVIALPERDHHAATVTLAGLLRTPAELVAVPTGWG